MNDEEIEVEVDLEAIHSKRRRALFDLDDTQDFKDTDCDIHFNNILKESELHRSVSVNPIKQLLRRPANQPSGDNTTNYRLYHFWRGNNDFCLEGKFLNGLKKRSFKSRLTFMLILVSFMIYLIFPAFYLYDKISPFITLLTVYTFLLTTFFYFMTFRYASVTQL